MSKAWSNPTGRQVSRASKFAKKLRERQRHKRRWNREKMSKRSRNVNLQKRGQRRKR